MARPGTREHPKFKRLCHILGMPPPHILGHLEFMWDVAYQSGEPRIGDAVDVELAAGWTGEPGDLCRALAECGGPGRAGFIEEVPGEPGAFQVHDLLDHAPSYVAHRAAKERERKKAKTCGRCGVAFRSTETHAKYCSPACKQASYRERVTDSDTALRNSDACVTERYAPPAPAPAPAPKEEEPAAQVCDEPPKAAASSPTVLTFPTVGKKKEPKEWHLIEAKLAEYRESFPGVDVLACCRAALQWCRDNPARRKTARGMPAFLSRWLTQEQNRGGVGLRHTGEVVTIPKEKDTWKPQRPLFAPTSVSTPAELATQWSYCSRCPGRNLDEAELARAFEGMVAAGWTVEELRLEIVRPCRDTSESFGEFRFRIKKEREPGRRIEVRTIPKEKDDWKPARPLFPKDDWKPLPPGSTPTLAETRAKMQAAKEQAVVAATNTDGGTKT